MEELKNIIKKLQDIRVNLEFKPSDDQLLDTAGRIYNTIVINGKKSESQTESTEQAMQNPHGKATDKQIWYLKNKAGFKGDVNNLTKLEASQVIKESKE